MYNRIRIKTAEGRISIRDLSFGQTSSLIMDLPKTDREAFWAKAETKLPNGDSVYLVREGV
jgi:hypothetical protein